MVKILTMNPSMSIYLSSQPATHFSIHLSSHSPTHDLASIYGTAFLG